MKSAVKLYVILVTITLIVVAWLTHQLYNPRIQIMISVLIVLSLLIFFLMNLLEYREERFWRMERESRKKPEIDPDVPRPKHSDASFSLQERKSGLTWGSGNIKASEATRGTKRKFLGRQ